MPNDGPCAHPIKRIKIFLHIYYSLILGWNGLSDSQKSADERKIKILGFAAVEIPTDPLDLDATEQLRKIRHSGIVLDKDSSR